MTKPFLIFRAGERTAAKSCALLLLCALLLTFSIKLYRLQSKEQGSMEVFAEEDRPTPPPQGVYALLEQLFGAE